MTKLTESLPQTSYKRLKFVEQLSACIRGLLPPLHGIFLVVANPFHWFHNSVCPGATENWHTLRVGGLVYLVFKWKQLLIVRDLFRPPPERLLRQRTDKKQSSIDRCWILTYDTLSHMEESMDQEVSKTVETAVVHRHTDKQQDLLDKKHHSIKICFCEKS